MGDSIIGQILLEQGYITPIQIRDVLKELGIPLRICDCAKINAHETRSSGTKKSLNYL